MKEALLFALLHLSNLLVHADGARVTSGRLFEYRFDAAECGAGTLSDSVAESLLGRLSTTAAGSSCAAVGVVSNTSDSKVPAMQSTGNITALVTKLNTKDEGFTLEIWLRPEQVATTKNIHSSSINRPIFSLANIDNTGDTQCHDPLTSVAVDVCDKQDPDGHVFSLVQHDDMQLAVVYSNPSDFISQVLFPDDVIAKDPVFPPASQKAVVHLVVRAQNSSCSNNCVHVKAQWVNATAITESATDASEQPFPVFQGASGGSVATNKWLAKPGEKFANRAAFRATFGSAPFSQFFSGATEPWNGQLYLAAMYDRYLSDAEVQQNFEARLPTLTTQTTEDKSVPAVIQLRAVDLLSPTDPLTDPSATVSVTSLPHNGTLFTDASGASAISLVPKVVAKAPGGGFSVYYSPEKDYHGADSFEYKVSAPSLNAVTQTALLDVIEVNDAPRVEPGALSTATQVC